MGKRTIFYLLLVVILMVSIAGCAQPQTQPQLTMEPTSQVSAVPTGQSTDTIMVADTALGTILVDSAGKTLYYFANDIPASNTSACNGKCAAIWPVFYADTVQVSPPLRGSDFTVITRTDGTKQTAFHGWPLYYYQADVKPGDMNGENVIKSWFVVKPDETVLIAQQASLGLYLTDSFGKTLYFFAKDTPGVSACSDSCLAKWPAFSADQVSAPSVLKAEDFSSVTRTDGVNQTAFMNRPLYYFADDSKPGDTKGQGFNNLWSVANISGIVPVSATPSQTQIPTTIPTQNYGSGSYGSSGYY